MQGGSLYYIMMVFGMTWPGYEPTTYRMRGGHTSHKANLTQSFPIWSFSIPVDAKRPNKLNSLYVNLSVRSWKFMESLWQNYFKPYHISKPHHQYFHSRTASHMIKSIWCMLHMFSTSLKHSTLKIIKKLYFWVKSLKSELYQNGRMRKKNSNALPWCTWCTFLNSCISSLREVDES